MITVPHPKAKICANVTSLTLWELLQYIEVMPHPKTCEISRGWPYRNREYKRIQEEIKSLVD